MNLISLEGETADKSRFKTMNCYFDDYFATGFNETAKQERGYDI